MTVSVTTIFRLRPNSRVIFGLNLFEFYQRPTEVFGVKKQHLLPVRANNRFTITNDSGARSGQFIAGRHDVVYLVADMVHSAARIALQKRSDW